MAERIDSPKKEIVKFLERYGWKVVVIGEQSVEQGDRALNFRYVLNFTGTRPKEEKEAGE